MKNFSLIRKTGLFLFVYFLMQMTFAQKNFVEGYVVTKEGDTTFGFIDQRDWVVNPEEIKFKKSLQGAVKTYQPHDIQAFKADKDIYVSAMVEIENSGLAADKVSWDPKFKTETDWYFLQALYQGDKELYYLRNNINDRHFYIKENGEHILLLYKQYMKEDGNKRMLMTNNKFVAQLSYYLRDCINTNAIVDGISYELKSLKRVFKNYYRCVDKTPKYTSVEQKLKTNFRIIAGMSFSSLNFKQNATNDYDYLTKYDYGLSSNLSFGVGLNIVVPKTKERWISVNEILFVATDLEGKYISRDEENVKTWYETDIKLASLKFIHMGRYNFEMGENLDFIGEAGITHGLLIASQEIRKKRDFYGIHYDNAYSKQPDYHHLDLGLIVGAGLSYKSLEMEIRAEISRDPVTNGNLKSSFQKYYFLMAITL